MAVQSQVDPHEVADRGLYPYPPSTVLPIVFSALIALSLVLHTYQSLLVPLDGDASPSSTKHSNKS